MDRDELTAALDDVAGILGPQRIHARIYIVGGAAMALAYDAARSTRDIDAVILDHHGPVTDAVREVGRRRGLPGSWLNEQASGYVPTGPDRRHQIVYDNAALTVMAASPEHLLAMKARAARVADEGDIVTLAQLTGCESAGDVINVVARVFPDEPVADRVVNRLHDILGPAPGIDL